MHLKLFQGVIESYEDVTIAMSNSLALLEKMVLQVDKWFFHPCRDG